MFLRLQALCVGKERRNLVMEPAKVAGVEEGAENSFFVPDTERVLAAEVVCRA